MNVGDRVLGCLWLAMTIAANGAKASGAEVIAGQIPGLWQTNGVVFHDGRPYRGVGANYFDLFLRVLHEPTNHTSMEGLDRLGKAGIPFVRFAVAYDETDWKILLDNREKFFGCLDSIVKGAERTKVGLIPEWRLDSGSIFAVFAAV